MRVDDVNLISIGDHGTSSRDMVSHPMPAWREDEAPEAARRVDTTISSLHERRSLHDEGGTGLRRQGGRCSPVELEARRAWKEEG